MQMIQQVHCVKLFLQKERNVVTDEWNFLIFLRPASFFRFFFSGTYKSEKKKKI